MLYTVNKTQCLYCFAIILDYSTIVQCTVCIMHIADNTALSEFIVFAINFSFVDETYYRWKHVGLYTIIALLPVQCTVLYIIGCSAYENTFPTLLENLTDDVIA